MFIKILLRQRYAEKYLSISGAAIFYVDSKNIKKHKNDVNKFIELIEEDKPDIKNLGIKGTDFGELIEILKNIYIIK